MLSEIFHFYFQIHFLTYSKNQELHLKEDFPIKNCDEHIDADSFFLKGLIPFRWSWQLVVPQQQQLPVEPVE
jgi:hypothetical protein